MAGRRLTLSLGLPADLPAGWPSVSAGGLVALVVLMLLTGGLVTRRQLNEANKRTEEANARADRWESVALQAIQQNRQLLPVAEIAAEVFKAIQQAPPPDTHAPPQPRTATRPPDLRDVL